MAGNAKGERMLLTFVTHSSESKVNFSSSLTGAGIFFFFKCRHRITYVLFSYHGTGKETHVRKSGSGLRW